MEPHAIIDAPNVSYTENLTFFGKIYYALIGSNLTTNTSLSNCVKADLTPSLMEICPNPNNNGKVILNWTSLVGASRYYVIKSEMVITEENYNSSSVSLIANITDTSFIDESNFNQGFTYYYVIIGTNITDNSTISNYRSVIMNIIPQVPSFTNLHLITYWEDIKIVWSNILYALNFSVYISNQKGFTPSTENLFNITNINSSLFTGLSHGMYYIRVRALGQYGNSNFSDELLIEVILFIPIKPDNPLLLLLLLIGTISISSIIIFSYFWVYLRNEKVEEIRKTTNQ